METLKAALFCMWPVSPVSSAVFTILNTKTVGFVQFAMESSTLFCIIKTDNTQNHVNTNHLSIIAKSIYIDVTNSLQYQHYQQLAVLPLYKTLQYNNYHLYPYPFIW